MLQARHKSAWKVGGLSQQVAQVWWQSTAHDDAISRQHGSVLAKARWNLFFCGRFSDQSGVLHPKRTGVFGRSLSTLDLVGQIQTPSFHLILRGFLAWWLFQAGWKCPLRRKSLSRALAFSCRARSKQWFSENLVQEVPRLVPILATTRGPKTLPTFWACDGTMGRNIWCVSLDSRLDLLPGIPGGLHGPRNQGGKGKLKSQTGVGLACIGMVCVFQGNK